LTAVDAAELTNDEIAKRLGWHGRSTDERATRDGQQDRCDQHRERGPPKPAGSHHKTITNRQVTEVPDGYRVT
jgi:hypothetical protein